MTTQNGAPIPSSTRNRNSTRVVANTCGWGQARELEVNVKGNHLDNFNVCFLKKVYQIWIVNVSDVFGWSYG